jgi:ABC-type multidrug transport system fused ATPase/permease subunit
VRPSAHLGGMTGQQEDKVKSGEVADWATVRRFMPYLWPKDRPELRWRIAVAGMFVVAAKAVVLTLPFAYARAVDTMSGETGNEALAVALGMVLAYSAGRFATVVFDNVRNIVFERVGQDAVRDLTEDVFARLHRLSLRFHLARRTGEVTRVIERGSKSINSMIYFLLFNILPTLAELLIVAVIFWINFGWEVVAATAVTVIQI